MDGDLLKSKRRSNHAPDGLRPHREPGAQIPAPIHLRDDAGPNGFQNHTRDLLRPDPSQARLPTSERLGELLQGDRVEADDAANATVGSEPDRNGDAPPPPASPPLMIDEVPDRHAPTMELQG
jgi:hypothetical protein